MSSAIDILSRSSTGSVVGEVLDGSSPYPADSGSPSATPKIVTIVIVTVK
jgi:hypothetical protein